MKQYDGGRHYSIVYRISQGVLECYLEDDLLTKFTSGPSFVSFESLYYSLGDTYETV